MESEDPLSFEEELSMREQPEILIVDDNTFNVYSLKLLIEEHFKYPTEIAYSGQEALNKSKKKLQTTGIPFRLVLTDINMPVMDGFQMSQELNRIMDLMSIPNERKSIIYAVTAMNDFEIKGRYQKYGIKEILTKPVGVG
jgi:CheY-like chemotaxis protein